MAGSKYLLMKQIIQNLGLIVFLIAVILLITGLLQDSENNTILLISGIMIVGGLIIHVILNKKFI